MSQSIHLTHITTYSSEHSLNYLTELRTSATVIVYVLLVDEESVGDVVESITGTNVVSKETDVESVFPVSVVDSFEPHALIAIIATNARKYVYFFIFYKYT